MPFVRVGAVVACWSLCAWAADDAEVRLERFRQTMKAHLERLPDYTCASAIERFSRANSEQAWERVDTLRLEVALVGLQEMYAMEGSRRFSARPLAQLVGRGTIGTGQFGLIARHVFLPSAVRFGYRGEVEPDGRKAHEYHYEVQPEESSYVLRSGNAEAKVPFQGTFWVDTETLDLVRLELQSYDIPERLGLSETSTVLSYAKVTVGSAETLLPVAATLRVVSLDGTETLNRLRLTGCRQYQAESTLLSDAGEKLPSTPAPVALAAEPAPETGLPSGTVLEVALDKPLDPGSVTLGDIIRAHVTKIAKGDPGILPEGSILSGRIVRLEKQELPFALYEVGLEFDTLEAAGSHLSFAATMDSAGPAVGLLRQARRLDPTFTRNRSARMDVLVREVQQGQGILLWEAKRGPIPRGLKMTWRVLDNSRR